jgi:hypothetical protein
MINLTQSPAPAGTITVEMTGHIHGKKAVKRNVSGTTDDVRRSLREEYRQHLIRMVHLFLEACESTEGVEAARNRLALTDALSDNIHADHLQLARAMVDTMHTVHVTADMPHGTVRFTREAEPDERGRFLAAMLPKGEGYSYAYGLKIDLTATAEAFLTDHSSLWTAGEWQQLPDAQGNTHTVQPWISMKAA